MATESVECPSPRQQSAQSTSAPCNSSTLTGRGVAFRPGRPGREGIGPRRRRRATLWRNFPGIERRGLRGGQSRGRLPVVWLHRLANCFGPRLHPIQRHSSRAVAVLILLVDVPRAWLPKNRKGLWYSIHDVSPDRIRRVLGFVDLAGACAA